MIRQTAYVMMHEDNEEKLMDISKNHSVKNVRIMAIVKLNTYLVLREINENDHDENILNVARYRMDQIGW